MKRLIAYFGNAWIELGKVNWPKPRQAARLTLVVVVFSLVLAAFIGLVDLAFKEALQRVILKG